MIPSIVLAVGVVALAGGLLILRSYGPRYRVGRLLATTPRVGVDEALGIAERGERRYVRVDGRVDAEDEFEDHEHRPLVFRRTRIEARSGGRRWTTLEDRREQVAFDVREGLAAIAIDAGALDAGLVVVPRESAGRAVDLGDRMPDGVAPTTPVRARIEQVSSVEHAIVLGVPVRNGEGALMSAGLGRPLVLTTLELPEAMRILAEGRTLRPRLAALLLAAGALLSVLGVAWLTIEALA